MNMSFTSVIAVMEQIINITMMPWNEVYVTLADLRLRHRVLTGEP